MSATGSTNTGKCLAEKFTSCPPIDLFIMFDGTSAMKAQFGTTPNGFISMVESVRGWVKTIPLSGSSRVSPVQATINQAAGFRIAMAQYGWPTCSYLYAPNSPSAPASTKGGCFDSTLNRGGASAFSGSLDELMDEFDFHESTYNYVPAVKYGNPAFNVALTAFNSYTSSREKILMILGDSYLDDRTTAMTTRTTLINAGVRIISAVVRPYSYQTTQDYYAQVYFMQPIATTTAMYQTAQLVNLKTDLLDTLCDTTKAWGVYIGNNVKMCSDYTTSALCNADDDCLWDTATSL
jgi:hypothetical protein